QRSLSPLLRSRGYEVETASSGKAALNALEARQPDLIVLDLGLPDIEGAVVCRRIRTTSKVPVIVLTARGSDADKASELELGADDYVTKRFSPEELLARIRVALRRVFSASEPDTGVLQVGDLGIDFSRRRVMRGSDELRLTPKEFELLSLLARNAD